MNEENNVYCPICDFTCPYYNLNTSECGLGYEALTECDTYFYYNNEEE